MPELKVPKSAVSVTLGLPTGSAEVEVYLADYARDHLGPERLSDVLAAGRFFPARREGRLELVSRDGLAWARVEDEEGSPELGACEAAVEVTLLDGSTLRGLLRFVAPAGRGRPVDYLNQTEGFFPLYEGGAVTFVNSARVASVRVEEPPK